MKVELNEITIGELTKEYQSDEDTGVTAYSGKLDIRPPYQREFVYNDEQRAAVINTVRKDFPLNSMYWAIRDNGDFEIIDGQQRTISICQYVNGDFSFEGRSFHNLENDEQEQILEYPLTVYICSGTNSEKLDWFETINIAGEKLMKQELRNAVFHGAWVTDAKRYFSKNGCVAYRIGEKYLRGTAIRQDYLETVIKWINNGNIDEYMDKNRHKTNANELWLYFQKVINWVEAVFPKYRSQMKGLPWGEFYNVHKDDELDPTEIEARISTLMKDDDVSKRSGIYQYILTGNEKHLNIRAFSPDEKRQAYERQNGICPSCGEHFEIGEMHGDHIVPWHAGGKTNTDNCQMLCRDCNWNKSGN